MELKLLYDISDDQNEDCLQNNTLRILLENPKDGPWKVSLIGNKLNGK